MNHSRRLERIRVVKSLIKNLEYQSFDMFNDFYSNGSRELIEEELIVLREELRTLLLSA